MKTKFIFSLIVTCWSSFSFAQQTVGSYTDTIKVFDISEYKTTIINRNDLRFNAGILGLRHSITSGRIGKFISNENKQISVAGQINKSFELTDITDLDRHINSANLDANAKFFSHKNLFIEIGLTNSVKILGLSRNFPIRSHHRASLGIGIGRIDFVDDASIAKRVIGELSKTVGLSRELNGAELGKLVKIIADIKNERYFANRSYSDFEPYQIAMFLNELGLISGTATDYAAFINKAFKYEPIINRTHGSQLKVSFSAGLFQKRFFEETTSSNGQVTLSWDYNKYITDKWQWNMRLSASNGQQRLDDPSTFNFSISNGRLELNNEIHSLIGTLSRITLINNLSSQPEWVWIDTSVGTEYLRDIYFTTKLEYEFLTSRETSITFGLSRGISRHLETNSLLNFRLKF